mmetsp:Transcript_6338/g.15809  ORF Transcript_6338/g.15809 Transcript_6338/m.15809 type:complete len:87 (+) Transcript_6338:69-329(+)
MPSIVHSQALRCLFHTMQVMIMASFLGVFVMALSTMNADPGVVVPVKDNARSSCSSRRTWLVFPFAFVTGGLMNVEGFATTTVLLL